MNKIEETLSREFSGAIMLTLVAETIPRVKKTCPYPGLVKRSVVNGVANFDYERAFQKRTGNLPPGEKPWYHQLNMVEKGKTKRIPLVTHPESKKQYVRLMVLKSKYRYVSGGKVIPDSAVEPYLQSRGENPTNIRVYTLQNIRRLHLHGQTVSPTRTSPKTWK